MFPGTHSSNMTNTLFIGKVYQYFEEIQSTNDWALEQLAKSKPPDGMVVRAATQTVGHGQFGSRWLSPAGQNLLLSVILYPKWLAARDQFYLSMAMALGLHETLDLSDARLKWPNDLYLGSKKAAGILIQNSLNGGTIQSSVVGIGLNVNQLEFDTSLPNPTSLAVHTGKTYDLDQLMSRLFTCLERRYLDLKAGRLAEIKHAYENRLYRMNETTTFVLSKDETAFKGVIRGVNEAGHLRVELEDGELAQFDLKAIRMQV